MFSWLKHPIETTFGVYLLAGVTGCVIGFVMGLTTQGVREEELRLQILKDMAQQAEKTFEKRATATASAWVEKFFVYPKQYAPYVVEINCMAHTNPASKDNAVCNVRLNNEFIELSCAIDALHEVNRHSSKIPCRLTKHIPRMFDIPTRANY